MNHARTPSLFCAFAKLASPLLSLFLASAAVAGPVTYVNNVPADGLPAGTKLEHCGTLNVDDKGNIHISCPDYDLRPAEPVAPEVRPAAAVVSTGMLTKHYWLVTQQATRGATQYDINLFINKKWIRKLKSDEDQVVLEVTKHLAPGENKIILEAKKHIEGTRTSSSAAQTFSVIVGEGQASADNVVVDNPFFEMKRTAAETQDVTEDFTVQAR